MVNIYLLKREFGSSLVLHPFGNRKQVIQEFEQAPLLFNYAENPTEDDRVHLLYGVYSLLDSAVDTWVQELKYIPRLLASAAAFLLVYLFAALVIRIPVPLVDEILFSSAAAVLVYFYVAKKNTRSDVAMKRRIELKNLADQAGDTSNPGLLEVQAALGTLEEIPPLALSDMICGRKEFPLRIQPTKATGEIKRYLETALGRKKRYVKLLKRITSCRDDRQRERVSAHLYHIGSSGKADLPLIALYILLGLNQK